MPHKLVLFSLLLLWMLPGCSDTEPRLDDSARSDDLAGFGFASVVDAQGDLKEISGPGDNGIDLAEVSTQELPNGVEWTLKFYGRVHTEDSRFHCSLETASGEDVVRGSLYRGQPSPRGAEFNVEERMVSLMASNEDFLVAIEPQRLFSECRAILTSGSGDVASDYSETHALDLLAQHTKTPGILGPFAVRTSVLQDSACDATAFNPSADDETSTSGKCPLADLSEVAIWQNDNELLIDVVLHDEVDHPSTAIQISYPITSEGGFQEYGSINYEHDDRRAHKQPGDHDLSFDRPDDETVRIHVPWEYISDRAEDPVEISFVVRSQEDHVSYADAASVVYTTE